MTLNKGLAALHGSDVFLIEPCDRSGRGPNQQRRPQKGPNHDENDDHERASDQVEAPGKQIQLTKVPELHVHGAR